MTAQHAAPHPAGRADGHADVRAAGRPAAEMTEAEAEWVRAHAWTQRMRRAYRTGPGAWRSCPCQSGISTRCDMGDHERCGRGEPLVLPVGYVETRAGHVAALPEPYRHPTPSATGPHRTSAAYVWHADRRCRWVCPCPCHQHDVGQDDERDVGQDDGDVGQDVGQDVERERRCPVCGTGLPPRKRTGRPAVYCRKACRDAAWRADRAAERAREQAAHLAGQVRQAHMQVRAAARALDRAAAAVPAGRAAGPVASGWETAVGQAAARLQGAADHVRDLAARHAQAVLEHQRARAVVLHRPAAPPPSAGASSAASPTSSAETAKPGLAPEAADELFDAVEDVVDSVLEGADDGGGLPAEFVRAVDRLADAHAAASGDGPVDELVAAVVGVCMTGQGLPPATARLVSRLHAALP